MKTVRTVQGTKRIEDKDPQLTLIQVRELLDGHRDTLINRLVGDLPAYVDYRFNMRINSKQQEALKEKLSYMKNTSVDMDKYASIFDRILTQDTTYVAAEPFYREIDDTISWYLNDSQLSLVK